MLYKNTQINFFICFLILVSITIPKYLCNAQNINSSIKNKNKYVSVPFYLILTNAINKAIESRFKTKITLASYPSQGDLMWYYKNANDYFNQGTLDYISARVYASKTAHLAQLSSSGGYKNVYEWLVSSLYYNISELDQMKINKYNYEANKEANELIECYEKYFGQISQSSLSEAQKKYGKCVASKLDYIIHVIVNGIWSGRDSLSLAPISYFEFYNASEILTLLPNLPEKGEIVIKQLQSYMAKIEDNIPFSDSAAKGNWTIQQLINNVRYPDKNNGGMKTINPYTGSISSTYTVGYSITDSINSIYDTLNSTNRKMEIVVNIRKNKSSKVKIITEWTTEIIDTIIYFIPDSTYIDMNPFPSEQSDENIEIDYFGFTLVNSSPMYWNENTNKGWYFSYPINQAIKNKDMDVTGYKFSSWPAPYNLSPFDSGGEFGYISQLLICKNQKTSITVGIADTSDKILFNAAPLVNIPQLQQSAYVIGGSFIFPPPEK